ncbi:hypothetical protein ABK040_016597 [Willaertia magna]
MDKQENQQQFNPSEVEVNIKQEVGNNSNVANNEEPKKKTRKEILEENQKLVDELNKQVENNASEYFMFKSIAQQEEEGLKSLPQLISIPLTSEVLDKPLKACVVTDYGKAKEVIQFKSDFVAFSRKLNHPSPKIIRNTQMVIKVVASSVNPIDCLTRSGKNWNVNYFNHFPAVLGRDVCGIVVQCGLQVTRFQVGDSVVGWINGNKFGACCDYAIVDEYEVIRKPEGISYAEAACFPHVGTAAIQAFKQHKIIDQCLKLYDEDDFVLFDENADIPARGKENPFVVWILGASGGVGSIACLLAKYFLDRLLRKYAPNICDHVKVYGVCSTKNASYVKDTLGADVIVEYNKYAENGQELYGKTDSDGINYNEIADSAVSKIPFVDILNQNGDKKIDLVLDCVGLYGDQLYSVMCKLPKCSSDSAYVCVSKNYNQDAELTFGSLVAKTHYLLWKKAWSFFNYPSFYQLSAYAHCNDIHLVYRSILADKMLTKIPMKLLTMDKLAEAHEMVETRRTVGKIGIIIDEELANKRD